MPKSIRIHLAIALALASAAACADTHPFPSSQPLVAAQLRKHEFGAGLEWSGLSSGGSNQFALHGYFGLAEPVDVALSLIPTGDGSMLAGGEILYTPWQGEAWSGGLGLAGYYPLGEIRTYHFDHGDVEHAVSTLRMGADARWTWLYFGMGYLHAWDRRAYAPGTAPADSRAVEYARKHPVYRLGGVQQHLGVRIGNELQFNVELGLMDGRFYNLLIEPSDPIRSTGLTLSAGITYAPRFADRKPAEPDPSRFGLPPGAAPEKALFNVPQYWRGVRYGALASLVGGVAGIAIGATQDEEDFFILPPEVLYALAGATVTIPFGSAYGVLSDPRIGRKRRAALWTLAGTTAGFAAGFLLAPVTAGASLYLLTPLGSAMGFRHGSD